MKVTFPHMGNLWISVKSLFEGLNLEVVVPPPCSSRTMELGVRHSPEFACLPLKINMGNFIEALENGADTIVMAGGWGPCRFGYYAQVEKDILVDLGFKFRLIVLEAPDSRLQDLIKQLKLLGQNVSFFKVVQAIRLAWEKLKAVDELESKLRYYLPRVLDPDRAEKVFAEGLKKVDRANTSMEIREAVLATSDELGGLPQNGCIPLRIGLVGEIYTLLEPASNLQVERRLGRLGAEVKKTVSLPQWVNDHLLGGVLKVGSCREAVACSSPYLNDWVGGHGRETVGYTVQLARQGFDGVVQVGPLTCMPEIVAQSVLGKVSQVEGIPVMTMYFDEQSAEAGVQTRLEAFIDMVRHRKRINNGSLFSCT
ncbi:MAG: CoA protein activase [Syntrophothermus sp.]|uniref:CoA protein activase n=1 Tax=Syntrophothermus sp. TaxID=2736299 RepID=UPI00257FCC44|nr:CoA protein activase [Syntrophothermus sp.]NSW82315.1 CoA protein activase [Syntrophothermus sp.]